MRTFKKYCENRILEEGFMNWIRAGMLGLASLLSPMSAPAQNPSQTPNVGYYDNQLKNISNEVLKELAPYQDTELGKQAIKLVPEIVKAVQSRESAVDQLTLLHKISGTFEDMKLGAEVQFRKTEGAKQREVVGRELEVSGILERWIVRYTRYVGEAGRQGYNKGSSTLDKANQLLMPRK